MGNLIKSSAVCRISTALVLALSLGACSGGSNNAPAFAGSTEIPGGAENPTPAQSDTPNNNNEGVAPTNVDELIAGLRFPDAASDTFISPSEADQNTFAQVIHDIIDAIPVEENTLAGLNYTLTTFSENGAAIQVLTDTSGEGGGTYLINPSSSSNLIIEVPHPLSDENTLAEGAFIFKNLQAKALLIAGTHRCASETESLCSGTSHACEGSYRISDVAHHTENFFHTVHRTVHDKLSKAIFISLHSYEAQATDPTVIVSNGKTQKVGPYAFVNKLDEALETALGAGNTSASCNLSSDSWDIRCGVDNVQGRFTNGSAEECSEAPLSLTGRFIHLEQASTSLENNSSWQAVADALMQVF